MADTRNTRVIFALRDRKAAVAKAAAAIRDGDVVVIPTETVYGLAANAMDKHAVMKIFEAKGRPWDNPLIVHIAETGMLEGVAECINDYARKLMNDFWPGPLSLVMKANENLPRVVTAGLHTVAVRMPAPLLTRDIITAAGVPAAAPSANRSGRLSPTTARHAFEDLAGKVGLVIDGGPCEIGVESTVADVTGDVPVILRPGHITEEMIYMSCGRRPLPADKKNTGTPRSPGIKYRHYAPNAEVALFEGDEKKVAKTIRELYYQCKERRPVVFCESAHTGLYHGIGTIVLGSGAADAERLLFACLRGADDAGHGLILFHYTGDMGNAVKNRIQKAAGQTGE